ncbi:hypothetical protein DZA10_11100 [Pseudomonas aeruginosa]|nr:hypothetical protein DZA10_11100 [Pseudomonas aeruginosa]
MLGHRTPLCGEHSRLNGCPGLVDHYTRMQVREYQFDWIVQLVGLENVKSCPSLRRYTKRLLPTLSL